MAKRIVNVSVRAKTDLKGNILESLESMIRRFKKKVEKETILQDIRKHEFYMKPSEKRKLKSKLARQRTERELAKKQKKLAKMMGNNDKF